MKFTGGEVMYLRTAAFVFAVVVLFGKSSLAQVNFKIGVDTFGNFESTSDRRVQTTDENGNIVFLPLEKSESSNLGVSLTFEANLSSFRILKFGFGVQYELPRELKNSN